MCEENVLETEAETEALELNKDVDSDTTPKEQIFIPVKFNKEVRNLTIDEAADLAQKGLKFNAISKDYEVLRSMANENNKSVSKYLEGLKTERDNQRLVNLTEKCGGDRELAEHILELEKGIKDNLASDIEEVREFFPEIKSAEQLPKEVLENSELHGRSLLDEYLRYSLKEKRLREEAIKNQKFAEGASSGSQTDRAGGESPEALEFLKGLWN